MTSHLGVLNVISSLHKYRVTHVFHALTFAKSQESCLFIYLFIYLFIQYFKRVTYLARRPVYHMALWTYNWYIKYGNNRAVLWTYIQACMALHPAECSNISPGNETNMCDHYASIFYRISTKSKPKTQLKTWNAFFLTLSFSKQNGASVKRSIVIRKSCNVVCEQKRRRNAQSGQQHFPCTVRQTNQGSF